MRGLQAAIATLVLMGAVLLAFVVGNPAFLGLILTVAIGAIALSTLLLWVVRGGEDPEARIARHVALTVARRRRLGRALESTELIEVRERGQFVIEEGGERAVKLLIELIRRGDRLVAKDAVEELGAIGVEAKPWIEAALPEVGVDAQVDLRLSLTAIAQAREDEDALPVARVFE